MPNGLLERIANRYQMQGYQIYGLPPNYPDLPLDWEGLFPDLCVQKGSERTAFFAALPHPCQALSAGRKLDAPPRVQALKRDDGLVFKTIRIRIRAAIENPGVHVCLFCSSRECPYKTGATACIFSRKIFDCVEIRRLLPGSRHLESVGTGTRLYMGFTASQWRIFRLTLIGGLLFALFIQALVLSNFLP